MAKYVIHSWPGNPRGNMVWIAAELAGVEFVRQTTTFADAQKPEFLAKHPLGKTPLVETPEGNLTETNTCMRFFARKVPQLRLMGKNAFEEGLVNQWLDFANCEFVVNKSWSTMAFQVWEYQPFDEKSFREARDTFVSKLKIVENYLRNNTYLAGHQLTIADICMYAWLAAPMAFVLDETWRKANQNVVRWFNHIGNNDAVRKYFGEPKFTKTLDYYGLNKKEEKKPKAEKAPQKQAPKAKEEKPKKKEEPVEEEPPKKKEGNPLDALPPTKFNFFDFKTLFVNAADKNEALDFFWKNFDPEGFSIWYIKYVKYEGEGIKLFLTSNLKDSFMQRLEHFRKYGFGVHGVYGEEGNYDIAGVWVWRGLDHPQEIKDLPNYEYHTYERLDHTNEKHRQIVKEFWTGLQVNESVCDGKVARDVGYFK